ncbi:hypothetical protein BMS3Bbin02_01455 [bacterium BMS3Bbin02]|nr:hypothetical protein BMS3Bbin02_01455 [bacterium BMS3Bbin02]
MPTLVQIDSGLVLVALHRRQQGGHVLGRVMHFEPGRLIRNERVRSRMRFVETVPGKMLDKAEELPALFLTVAVRDTARHELLFLFLHD